MSSSRKKTKRCPRIGKPCIEKGCTHWRSYPITRMNELTGSRVTEMHYMCNDHWMTKMLFDMLQHTDYTGKALNQVRNQVAEGNATMGGLVYAANKRLNNGEQPEEKIIVKELRAPTK